LTGLKTEKFHDKNEFKYGFFDVQELNNDFVYGRIVKYKRVLEGEIVVMDPKNWTLPLGVELRTRKEVQNAEETQEFQCGVQSQGGA